MWQTLAGLAVVFALGTSFGHWVGATAAQKEIKELRDEHLHLVEQINRESNEAYSALADQLADREKRLADALSARDDALALAATARADASRLRILADNRSKALRALPTGSGVACAGEREQLARCVGLLGEGVDLLSEGAGLSLRTAADKDAVSSAR